MKHTCWKVYWPRICFYLSAVMTNHLKCLCEVSMHLTKLTLTPKDTLHDTLATICSRCQLICQGLTRLLFLFIWNTRVTNWITRLQAVNRALELEILVGTLHVFLGWCNKIILVASLHYYHCRPNNYVLVNARVFVDMKFIWGLPRIKFHVNENKGTN